LCVQATIGPLGHDTALLYSLGTAIIGHHFWTMSGMERVEAEISFFKNVSIMAGLLLPYLMGPGRYSLESKIKLS
jgi:putative oxidoreductase